MITVNKTTISYLSSPEEYTKLIIKIYPDEMYADAINKKILTIFSLLTVALLIATYAAPRGNFVLIITNPFGAEFGAMNTISNAGGTFVSQGKFNWITIAHSEDYQFSSRLRQAGALLVLNHQIAFGCLRT